MAQPFESNPRAAQVRLKSASGFKTGGNRKHDLRIGQQPKYVDEKRTHLNRVIIKPKTTAEMTKRAAMLRERGNYERKMKTGSAVSYSGIITFGHLAQDEFEKLTPEAQDAAFLELAQSIAKFYKVELTGLVVHLDEEAIHAHFQMDAYDEEGVSLSNMQRADLREVQDMTFNVMAKHCPKIERGRSKIERLKAGAKPSDVTYKTPAEMRRNAARDLEAKEAERDKLTAERDKLAARVAKLEAYEGELTERGAKQLETATRRLAAKNAELAEVTNILAQLQAKTTEARAETQKAEQRRDKAEQEAQAAEALLEALRPAVEALEAHETALEAQRAEVGKIGPQDAQKALEWLSAPLNEVISFNGTGTRTEQGAMEEFHRRLMAGKMAVLTGRVSLESYALDAPPNNLADFPSLKTVMQPELWALNVVERRGVHLVQVAQSSVFESEVSKVKSPFVRDRVKEVWSTVSQVIQSALTGIARELRARAQTATIKPEPPEAAKPLLDLPQPTQDAVREALKSKPPTSGPGL